MAKVSLNKWGNSLGLRVPIFIIKKAGIQPGEEYEVTITDKGAIIFSPIKDPQAGWQEAFNLIAAKEKEESDSDLDLDLSDIPNQFDEKEWTW